MGVVLDCCAARCVIFYHRSDVGSALLPEVAMSHAEGGKAAIRTC